MIALTEPEVGTAYARMTRILYVGASAAGLAFAALASSRIVSQRALLEPDYSTIVTIVLTLGPVLVLALCWWTPLRVMRAIAIGYIVVYVAGLLTWRSAMHVDAIPDGRQPWIIDLLPMPVFTGAVVLSEWGAWALLVGMTALAGVLRWAADGMRSVELPAQDMLFNGMTLAVFVAITIVTLRAGRRRDEAARATAQDAVIAAAVEAQDLQRAQVAALTHDDVISTLLAAARSTDGTAALVRTHARRAIGRLDELGADDDEAGVVVSSDDLVATLRETVAALSSDVRFRADPVAPATLPSVVARTLAEATAEAVRNSLRHAVGTTDRLVSVSVGPEAASVEILDDGVGFDPDRVPSDRFGVRLSITHRMALVTGGSATIDSRPGRGTRVVLTWRPA